MKRFSVSPLNALCLIASLEQSAFNGIRSLLVLYATTALAVSDGRAFELYASMMALGFFTPLLGGHLVDGTWGPRATLGWGMGLLFSGLVLLALPYRECLFPALGFIIVGSGLAKSAVQAAIAELPESSGDSDSRFARFFAFLNFGTLTGILGCAMVGELFGWRVGFLFAASLVFLLTPFLFSSAQIARRPHFSFRPLWLVLGIVAAAATLIQFPGLLKPLLVVAMIVIFGRLGWRGFRTSPGNTVSLFLLMAFHAVFFALYEQGALSMNLFASRNVDRRWSALIPFLGEGEIPVTLFQTIDPLFNVLFGSVFVWIWAQLARRGKPLGIWSKFSLGFALASLAFALLAYMPMTAGRLSPWLLIAGFAIFVTAEQLTVPMGFSAVKTLAPPREYGFYLGCWFLSISASEWLAEFFSKLTAPAGVSGITALESATVYQRAFFRFTWIALGLCLVLVLLGRHRTAKVAGSRTA